MTKSEKKKLLLVLYDHKINSKEKSRAIKRCHESRMKLVDEMIKLDLATVSPALYVKIVNEWL